MNIVKLRKHKNQYGSIQLSVTIPSSVADKIKDIDQLNVEYNENTGYIECQPIKK